MKKQVTVFGSFVVDLMARAELLPQPGQTVLGNTFRQGAGGKGFNQAVAAHKAGANVAAIMKLGRDPLSEVAHRLMDSIGLSKAHLLYSNDTATGTALIMVCEQSGQNAIVIVPGACATVCEEEIDAECICSSDYLLLQLEANQSANKYAAKLAKQAGVRVIVNPAPYRPMSDEFLRDTYLVTPNETEAQAMTGVVVRDMESAALAASRIHAKGVQNVLITLGSRGVYLSTADNHCILPAFAVHAVDTTGAGDAFNGALLAMLAEGTSIIDAANFANAFAALSVQKLGTADAMPTRGQTIAFLKEHSV